MNNTPPPTEDTERTARHLHQLQELAALTLDVVRILHAQIAAPQPDPASRQKLAAVFNRTNGALRQTIALEASLADARRRRTAAAQAAAEPRREAQRAVLYRLTQDAIRTAPAKPAAVDSRLTERLLDPEIYQDFDPAKLAQAVARICRDIGVHPP